MGKTTGISWTDHTFNIAIGCQKVSPACQYCYAEWYADRHSRGKGFLAGKKLWGGPESTRHTFGDDHWDEPLRWNRAAEKEGVKRRVFCSSLADVFEARQELDSERLRLWQLIKQTPHLIWMLLTKRPENVGEMAGHYLLCDNIWIGTTCENQEWFDKRMPRLAEISAMKRFISCEPLLGPIDIRTYMRNYYSSRHKWSTIDWVIVGGESGPNARPMNPDWARDLRDQCHNFGIPFHFKQWGELLPADQLARCYVPTCTGEWIGDDIYYRIGKRRAGNLLDGKQHKEFPV